MSTITTRKVVIIRHSESQFNKLNLFCGWHDSPLSDKGLKDTTTITATNLNKYDMKFDKVYTSLLKRAQQTTEIILEKLNQTDVPVIKDWRLNERHYGNLTGFNKRVMANKYGEEQVQKWRRVYDYRPPPIDATNPHYFLISKNPNFSDIPKDRFPLAESMQDTYERVIPAWLEIKKEVLGGSRILIVTHGTVTRCLVKEIEGISDADISKVNMPNSVPCVYEFNSETGNLVGTINYLADEEYVKREILKVASLGAE